MGSLNRPELKGAGKRKNPGSRKDDEPTKVRYEGQLDDEPTKVRYEGEVPRQRMTGTNDPIKVLYEGQLDNEPTEVRYRGEVPTRPATAGIEQVPPQYRNQAYYRSREDAKAGRDGVAVEDFHDPKRLSQPRVYYDYKGRPIGNIDELVERQMSNARKSKLEGQSKKGDEPMQKKVREIKKRREAK